MAHFKPVYLRLIFITFIVLCIAWCNSNPRTGDAPASAGQSENKMDTMNAPKPNITDPSDKLFLDKAAEINMEEIQLGTLAQQKSKMADIKNLGKMMEADYSRWMESLKVLAGRIAFQLPTSPDLAAKTDYKTFESTSGI